MHSADLVFCIPVFNDWPSAQLLLRRLDQVAQREGYHAAVLLVDDASVEPPPPGFASGLSQIDEVRVLHLRSNLGHQRAIALGLAYLHQRGDGRNVVIMDADGEDRPEAVPELVDAFRASGGGHVIFAERSRRSEGLLFRLFYQLYRLLQRTLTGMPIRFGNFSLVPASLLGRVVSNSELWNHYAATMIKSRMPLRCVPIARGPRLSGRPRMNFVDLVIHGLSAISVFREAVHVRLLVAATLLILLAGTGLCAVVGIRLFTNLAIPGWATSAAGILLLIVLNGLLLCLMFIISLLQSRSSTPFLPLRDYAHYLASVEPLAGEEKATGVPTA